MTCKVRVATINAAPSHAYPTFLLRAAADGANHGDKLFSAPVQEYESFVQGGDISSDKSEEAINKAAGINSSGIYMLGRVEYLCTASKTHLCSFPHGQARFLPKDGRYPPGPAITISESIVCCMVPPSFKQHVEKGLRHGGRLETISREGARDHDGVGENLEGCRIAAETICKLASDPSRKDTFEE